MYTMGTVKNNTLYTWILLRSRFQVLSQKKCKLCELTDMLISLIMVISQYIHISKHHTVHFRYIQFYLSIAL